MKQKKLKNTTEKEMRFIAIDPGKNGGVAFFDKDGLIKAFPFRSESDAVEDIRSFCMKTWSEGDNITIILEHVGGYVAGNPASGSSMFKFGDSYGFWRGLAAGLACRLELVRPQVWERGIIGICKLKGAPRKRVLKDTAARLFPGAKPTLATADAILIGEWGRKNLK